MADEFDETSDEQSVSQLIDQTNIAEHLDEDRLNEIGNDAFMGYEYDLDSRSEWENCLDEWLKLAKQVKEEKSYPWPKASNVKYPLLSTAAMQFAARAYPSLVPANGKIVYGRVVGKDPKGEKLERATRVSTFMSWQLLEEMEGWEEGMDKLLIMLPVMGTVFKKTYWDPLDETNCSKVILPKDLIVNYWAKSLKRAERISEYIEMSPRKLKERQNAKLFLDIDLGQATLPEARSEADAHAPAQDETTPYVLIEQHTFLDLDDDGYKEPYIVTFHKDSKKVLRIVANYDKDQIKLDEEGNVIKIDPVQYYTKFGFIPNPDGGFYDIGFGVLLGPINESVNTLINQLVDAGTLNNLQGGFLGKGLRLRMGETRFQPGEWKAVNATGDDLRKQIVPLPSKEPSSVLFQLMGTLISSGKELASVAEIFVGKMPGQNTPATTTMATIEQGMKVFTAVYKRLYRSLAEEFKKLYRLNQLYVNPDTEIAVLDSAVGPDDFNSKDYDIVPGADPTAISQTEKLMKAQGLAELLSMAPGILDPVKVVYRILDAQEQPSWQELINPQVLQSGQMPPPAPDPKMLEMQAKLQAEQGLNELKASAQQQKMELDGRDSVQKMQMKAQTHAQDMEIKAQQATLGAAKDLHNQRIFMAGEAAKKAQELTQSEQQHQQKLSQQKQQAQVAKKSSKGKP